MASFRDHMGVFIATPFFRWTVVSLILLNAFTLGLQTNNALMAEHADFLNAIDFYVIIIFVLELALRIYVHRLAFFKDGWNVFDFLIVGVSLIPASGPFSILRTLRVLRLLRLISVVPRMRRVVDAMLDAIPGMGAVAAVMLVLFYVFSVLTTQVFGVVGGRMQELYGSIGQSMWTLFKLMTLEGWDSIAEDTLVHFPYAWLFYVVFIIIMTFAVLNLFIGIIVDAMNILHEEDSAETIHKEHSEEMLVLKKLECEMKLIRKDIAELKKR